ncbi:unnamed protein product [Ectocarpus fasciculatus]
MQRVARWCIDTATCCCWGGKAPQQRVCFWALPSSKLKRERHRGGAPVMYKCERIPPPKPRPPAACAPTELDTMYEPPTKSPHTPLLPLVTRAILFCDEPAQLARFPALPEKNGCTPQPTQRNIFRAFLLGDDDGEKNSTLVKGGHDKSKPAMAIESPSPSRLLVYSNLDMCTWC